VIFLRHAAALLLGAAVALASVVVHRSDFPWGLLVALAATFAVPWRLLQSRWPRTASTYVVGWLALFGFVVAGRPEGDYAIGGDLEGYTLMGAGLVLVLVAVVGFTKEPRSDP
jgi:hypothetical protein